MGTNTLGETARREIRAEMARQSLSQLELGSRLGWSRMSASRRLSGRIDLTLDEVERIAQVLGVPVSQLTQPNGERS